MELESPRDEAAVGVVCREHVRVLGESARIGPQEQPAVAPGPQVHLLRDGETVRAIEIVCTCGERIVLNCIYEHENKR